MGHLHRTASHSRRCARLSNGRVVANDPLSVAYRAPGSETATRSCHASLRSSFRFPWCFR